MPDILQPAFDTFDMLDALPQEVRHVYLQALDAEAQRAYQDHGEERDRERSEAEAQELLERSIERQQKAVDAVRRRKEEALAVGTLSAEAEVFHELHLKPKLTEAHDFEPKIKTPVVQNLFNKNSLCWVVGSSGTFKSFVTADLAFRYGAEDMDYHGRKMTHGRSLIIVAEGAEGYAHRKTAWEREHDRTVKNVVIYPGALQLGDVQKEMAALIHHLREEEEAGRPYGLIMVDTQAMCTVGVDENTSEMNLVINVLHRIRETSGACVMVVHHFGKDKRAGMRGSSMLYAAADTVLVLKRKDDELDVVLSTAQADEGKQKEGINEKDFLTLELKAHTVGEDYFGDPVSSLVPVAVDGGSHDVRDEADIDIPTEVPWVTEQQMEYLKLIAFYEHRGATPSDMAAKLIEEKGPIKNARQNVRNRMIDLAKINLVQMGPAKGAWQITPLGVSVIAQQLAVGDNWVERAGRRRRASSRPGEDQTGLEVGVSPGVSQAPRNLTPETPETSAKPEAKPDLTCDETQRN